MALRVPKSTLPQLFKDGYKVDLVEDVARKKGGLSMINPLASFNKV